MRSDPDPFVQEILDRTGLQYVCDQDPGYQRRRCGKGFLYLTPQGRPLRSQKKLHRIRSLVIPPAWSEVWICPHEQGHLQATGRDQRKRKQYIYHPEWQETALELRFDQLIDFAEALPRLRRKIRDRLRRKRFGREKVLACVLQVLDKGHLRVGNEVYTRTNQSYGLTTLLKKHVEIKGPGVHFHFRGKKGKERDVELDDRSVARTLTKIKDLPGEHLFSYVDSKGEVVPISSEDVNATICEWSGGQWSAKIFRTWWGSVLAHSCLSKIERGHSATSVKRQVVQAVKEVAGDLGNTPAICRRHYIHPKILQDFEHGRTLVAGSRSQRSGLSAEERGFLAYLCEEGK